MFTLYLICACVLCCIVVALRWRLKNKRFLELARQVPTYKGYLPVIGHSCLFLGDSSVFWETVKEASYETQKAGGVVAVWIGTSLNFLVNDPDDAYTILNTCLEKSDFYKMGAAWVGNGLILADVPTWKRNRKLLNPTFSQYVLDGFIEVFNTQSKLLADDFQQFADKVEFDPRPYLTDRTLETICQTAVGISLDDKNVIDKDYKKAVERIFDILSKRLVTYWMHPNFIYNRTNLKKEEDKVVAVLHNMSRSVLRKRKEERKNVKVYASARRFIPFLDLLLDLADDEMFTDEQIREELDTLIAAGHDTSSRALLYIMIFIGTYPDVQEKVYKEVMSVIGENPDISSDDLTNMVYLEAVVKETLRLNPVTPLIARNVTKEVKLKEYTLPAGSGCIISFWGIHRHPCWGADVEQFKPERWLNPDTLPQSPGAYCAFSVGKRNCIGKTYGYMSMKTTLAHIIRRYKITADYSKLRCQFDILMKPISGYHIALQSRY